MCVAIGLVKSMTEVIDAKQQLGSRELRIAVHKALHIKQFEETEENLTEGLTPFFDDQIQSSARKLESVGDPYPLEENQIERTADRITNQIFDPSDWDDKLIDITLPILAVDMAKTAVDFFLSIGVEVRRKRFTPSVKVSTATQWLAAHPEAAGNLEELFAGQDLGIVTELPEWMKEEIGGLLQETFEQPYWEDINAATGGNINVFLKDGLRRGVSIRDMANQMKMEFSGGTDQYNKMRATRIARTESGNALNGIRKASMDRLTEDLPDLPIRPSWLSVLGTTTRASHANLDGVPADDDGLWILGGVRIPWPSHIALDVGDRANCQCTTVMEFGISQDTAQQLIQDHVDRIADEEARIVPTPEVEPVKPKPAPKPEPEPEPDQVFPSNQVGDSRRIPSFDIDKLDPVLIQSSRELNDQANEEQKRSVKMYTALSFEEDNDVLRKGRRLTVLQSKQIENLDAVIDNPLSKPVTVYRGLGESGPKFLRKAKSSLKKDITLTDKAFVSTSADPQVATKIAGKTPIVLQIRAKRGVYVESITFASGEHEVILPRDSEFRVVGIDKEVEIDIFAKDGTKKTIKASIIRLEQL